MLIFKIDGPTGIGGYWSKCLPGHSEVFYKSHVHQYYASPERSLHNAFHFENEYSNRKNKKCKTQKQENAFYADFSFVNCRSRPRSTPEVVPGQGHLVPGVFPVPSHLFPGIAVTRKEMCL